MYNLRPRSRNIQNRPVPKAKKAKPRDPDLDETISVEDFLKSKRKNQHEKGPEIKRKKVETPVVPDVPGGLVMTFGDDFCGELGLGKTGFTKKRPVSIEIEKKVTQVACGGMHTVCLTVDNEIYTWGCNDEGALGRSTDNPPKGRNLEAEPEKMPFSSKVKKVTAGDSHSAALDINGDVYIWGNFKDSTGNIGIHPNSDSLKGQFQPIRVELSNSNFVDISSGVDHILLLKDDGTVYSLGSGEQGQLGRLSEDWKDIKNNRDIFLKPAIVEFADKNTKCDKIWAGQYSSFARAKNGDIYGWGLNNYCQLGTNTHQQGLVVPSPVKIPSLSRFNSQIDQICQGQHFMLCKDSKGKVYSCGRHEYGKLGHGKIENSLEEPKQIEKLTSETIKCIAVGTMTAYAVNEKGQLFSWGMSGASLGLGDDDVWEPTLVVAKNLSSCQVLSVAAGSAHVVIIVTPENDGILKSIGS